jgi:hypothetical protein
MTLGNEITQTQRTLNLLREEWTAPYRALIEQFLEETTTYEDMFVSDLRDRVGDFREACRVALPGTEAA